VLAGVGLSVCQESHFAETKMLQQELVIIQGNSILAQNAPAYSEIKSYANLLTEGYLSSKIIDEIKKYDWNDNTAIAIAICESRLNPYAYNPETLAKQRGITIYGSYGIFQLNRAFSTGLYDYKYNISEAYQLYLRRGFQPWTCYQKLSTG
jgi:hypothetical protein